jgi:hypothetical protein
MGEHCIWKGSEARAVLFFIKLQGFIDSIR